MPKIAHDLEVLYNSDQQAQTRSCLTIPASTGQGHATHSGKNVRKLVKMRRWQKKYSLTLPSCLKSKGPRIRLQGK
jgi:hypothetical protein